jgi:hypothetical protein
MESSIKIFGIKIFVVRREEKNGRSLTAMSNNSPKSRIL